MITPLLVNTRIWYVDEINSSDGMPQPRSLADHIQKLFETVLPVRADQAYDLRVTCRYGFALVADQRASVALLSELPVLLGPRFTISAGAPMLTATEHFRTRLVDAIRIWKEHHNPVETRGMFLFSITLFSNLNAASNGDTTNPPLLRIEQLRLRFENIIGLT